MGFLRSGRVHKLTKDNLAKVPNSAGNYNSMTKIANPSTLEPRQVRSVPSGVNVKTSDTATGSVIG